MEKVCEFCGKVLETDEGAMRSLDGEEWFVCCLDCFEKESDIGEVY